MHQNGRGAVDEGGDDPVRAPSSPHRYTLHGVLGQVEGMFQRGLHHLKIPVPLFVRIGGRPLRDFPLVGIRRVNHQHNLSVSGLLHGDSLWSQRPTSPYFLSQPQISVNCHNRCHRPCPRPPAGGQKRLHLRAFSPQFLHPPQPGGADFGKDLRNRGLIFTKNHNPKSLRLGYIEFIG